MQLVICGGGGFRVPLVYRAVAARRDVGVDRVVLYDPDRTRLQAIATVLADDVGPRLEISSDLAQALVGADVVFAAIRVGGAHGRVGDERRALDRGVLGQETVGAGGLAYGLRTLPVMRHLAETIAHLAPQALTINFTNPAGLITEGLRPILGDKLIGICDSPIGLVRRVRRVLDAPADAIADYVGINHLGWLRSLRVQGRDLLPKMLADPVALRSFEEGRLFDPALLRALGAIPNEYLYFYYTHRDVVSSLSSGHTRGEVLASDQDAFYADVAADPAGAAARWVAERNRREASYLAEARDADEQRDAADLAGGGYEHVALDIMAAAAGGPPAELIVNVPNNGAVTGLPDDMVLELPSRMDASGATALPVSEPLDLHMRGLMCSVRAAEQMVITAVDTGSRDAALAAFEIHPLLGSPQVARGILDDLLASYPQLAALLR